MADGDAGIDAVFSRFVSLARLRRSDRSGRIEATAAGAQPSLPQRFGIESLDSFTFDYRLQPVGTDRAHLSGEIRADLTQLCVVTLEPVLETVEESRFRRLLAARADRPRRPPIASEADPLGLPADPPAPIVNGSIDVGALAGEILASAINPYPRKDDAEFGWNDPEGRGWRGLRALRRAGQTEIEALSPALPESAGRIARAAMPNFFVETAAMQYVRVLPGHG